MKSSFYESALAGMPLKDALIIDEHCHMGPCGAYVRGASAEDIIADMDNLGIDRAIVSHSMSILSDYRRGNSATIAAIEQYPDRFYGYCTLNPLYPDETMEELERCFTFPGMKGIKLHPYCHERPLSYTHYRPAYEYAAENRIFVMSHTYTAEDIDATDRLAREFPEAVFIMAHMGGEKQNVERALEVAGRHENVYGDLAVSQSMEGVIEWYVREIGSKKVLFGTDGACMSPVATLALVAMAEISDDEKRDIFGMNMQRILDRAER